MAERDHGPATWAQIGGSLIGAAAIVFVIGGLEVANEERVRPFQNNWIRLGFLLAAIGTAIVISAGVSAGKSWRRSRRKTRRDRLRRVLHAIPAFFGWPLPGPPVVAPAPRHTFEHVFNREKGVFYLRLRRSAYAGLFCEVFDPRIERWARADHGDVDDFGTAQVCYPDDFQDAHTGTPTPGRYGVRWSVKEINSAAKATGEHHLVHGPDWFDHDGNEFQVTRQVEVMTPDHAEAVHGKKFRRLTMLYAVVANYGETAEFSAHIDNAEGLKAIELGEDISAGYGVDEVAWEHTAERRKEISADGSARLLLLTVARRPRPYRLWFWTAKSEKWAPGVDRQLKGLRLRPTGSEFRFDLHVLNEMTGERVTQRGCVRVSDRGDVLAFDFAAA